MQPLTKQHEKLFPEKAPPPAPHRCYEHLRVIPTRSSSKLSIPASSFGVNLSTRYDKYSLNY